MSSPNPPAVEHNPALTLRQDLLDGLSQGQWAPGSRLPTERALCERYGVSRSVLRRVLHELRDTGLIVQKVGSGTYVADDLRSRFQGLGFEPSAISPAEIMEARLLLEPVLMDLIVANATAADFAHFEHCCEQAEAAETLEVFEHWDGALHEHLAHATHNAFFISIFALVAQVRHSGEWGTLKKKSVTPERRQRYQIEHRQIVAALKNRDADAARQSMMEHLLNVRRNLLGPVTGR